MTIKVLLVDNYDSFTYNLAQAFGALGAEVTVLRADDPALAAALDARPDRLVISPGPGRPEAAGRSPALVREGPELGIPTLGVCLGLQCAAVAVGASVMAGEATPAQLGALLAALHIRGETVDEIAGCASALREVAVRVTVPADAIDIVGTGGDRSNSFNISTVSAIVTAAAGGRVAKHGNRAATSACGSADVLEALGVRIDLGAEGVAYCVEESRMGFMFAPRYHPAMRHAGPVRREIGIRTVFNVLGPLANPAGVRRLLLGVPSVALGEKIAGVLAELGTDHALVVHGEDGLDEISPSLPTRTWEVRGGSIAEGRIEPEDLGVTPVGRAEITGGDPAKKP